MFSKEEVRVLVHEYGLDVAASVFYKKHIPFSEKWLDTQLHILSQKEGKELIINNCDGCQSNAPLKDGYHLDKDGKVYMVCQKSRYTTEKHIELNQTEAEKEDAFEKYLDNEITLNISDKKSIERVKWYYKTYFKGKSGLSLARKQVIEEI
jgi:hypothetical protein